MGSKRPTTPEALTRTAVAVGGGQVEAAGAQLLRGDRRRGLHPAPPFTALSACAPAQHVLTQHERQRPLLRDSGLENLQKEKRELGRGKQGVWFSIQTSLIMPCDAQAGGQVLEHGEGLSDSDSEDSDHQPQPRPAKDPIAE
eukprot:2975432-Rhodomonas_salina.2